MQFRLTPLSGSFPVCHLDRGRRSGATEGEWRDRDDVCAAMLIQGVLSIRSRENTLRQLLRCRHPWDLSTPRSGFLVMIAAWWRCGRDDSRRWVHPRWKRNHAVQSRTNREDKSGTDGTMTAARLTRDGSPLMWRSMFTKGQRVLSFWPRC